ncbi:multidrug resistance-associated protein 2, partial [Magnaporthiopsis poae ATCC 64411]
MLPFMLRFLIAFVTEAYVAAAQLDRPQPNLGSGFGLVVGITAVQVVQSLCAHQFMYRGMLVGGQSRASLISMIYDKSMVISGRARAGGNSREKAAAATEGEKNAKGPSKNDDGAGWANGRIINLMSVDTSRIDKACGMFHVVWTAPASLVLTLVVLLVNLGPSALAGFGLLVIGAPLLTRVVRSLVTRRRAINRITDQRVSLTQEILRSVRFVKYFGWEESFLQRLNGLRTREVSSIQVLLALRNAILAVSTSLPVFAAMLSFIAFSLSGNTLRSELVFSSLALFNGLRNPLNLLPLVLGQVTDAWSSLKRIEEFLLAEEQVEDVISKPDGENALEVRGADFTWEKTSPSGGQGKQGETARGVSKGQEKPPQESSSEKSTTTGSSSGADSEPFKLQDLNFEIGRGELIAVIGSVGSGKSSLLSALAGDMRKTKGEVVLGASRAFCPQQAWVQNTTVRDNITFGKDMDEDWYHEVIKACALEPDLEMLPDGDLTEVGERGITISGGQKQRVNIARAIYFDADIVLMDDPLSAVDAHVGRHIFDNAILGLLGDKCRILATHQLWVLNRCDRIIWMDAGKIQAIDSFDNLMGSHAGFRQLMESQSSLESNKKDEAEAQGEAAPGAASADADAGTGGETEEKNKTKLRKGKSMMQAEEQAVSSVPWSVYGDFVRASGSILNAPAALLLLVLAQGANIMTSLWLSWWTGDKFRLAAPVYMGVYAGLGVVQVLLTFTFMLALSILGTRASKEMLRRAMARVLRAPMAFFDTTPLGRITNRFSRDVDVMDNNLSDAMRMYFVSVGSVLSALALILAFFPPFAIAL